MLSTDHKHDPLERNNVTLKQTLINQYTKGNMKETRKINCPQV